MNGREPIGRRIGIDPAWWEERGHWEVAQVFAPCEKVAHALSNTREFEHRIYDAFDDSLAFSADWQKLVFVFQLQGHEWTLVDSIIDRIPWDIAEEISAQLSTQALIHAYENTGGVYGYGLFENGGSVEELYFGNTGEFDDNPREIRDEKIAEGWMLSTDNCVGFRSELLSDRELYEIDLNDESLNIRDRRMRDFGVYIPCDVWKVDSKTGRITLADGWSERDFQDAKILLSAN